MPNIEQNFGSNNDPIYKEMVNELLDQIVLKEVSWFTGDQTYAEGVINGSAIGYNEAIRDLESIKQKLRNDFTE